MWKRSCLVLVVLLAAASVRAEDAKESATKAARAWLALVDAGKYGASYDQAATFFKKNVSKGQWEAAVKQVRGATGALVSRKLKSATFSKTLPGAPEGQYVVIIFDASFRNKKDAIETITPMLDADKTWRVAGYFIR